MYGYPRFSGRYSSSSPPYLSEDDSDEFENRAAFARLRQHEQNLRKRQMYDYIMGRRRSMDDRWDGTFRPFDLHDDFDGAMGGPFGRPSPFDFGGRGMGMGMGMMRPRSPFMGMGMGGMGMGMGMGHCFPIKTVEEATRDHVEAIKDCEKAKEKHEEAKKKVEDCEKKMRECEYILDLAKQRRFF